MYVEDGNEGLVKCGAQGSPKPEVSWIGLDRKYTSDTIEGTSGQTNLKHIVRVGWPEFWRDVLSML